MKKAFVIMPFSSHLAWVYHEIIKPACDQMGVSVTRADDINKQRSILRDIVENIIFSDVTIADLTDHNANVFYELGAAHALMRPVIILTQSVGDIPFDLRSHRVIAYSTSEHEKGYLISRLVATLKETLNFQYEASSPICEYMPIPFAARIIQANRHARPVGSLHLFRNGKMGVLIGEGKIEEGLVIEPSYPIKTVNWGSGVTGWGWNGKDTVYILAKNTSSFTLTGLVPTSMNDINGTPYIRTVHDELIYFDLFLWKIYPEAAFQKTESKGLYSGKITYPLESLEEVPEKYRING